MTRSVRRADVAIGLAMLAIADAAAGGARAETQQERGAHLVNAVMAWR